MAVYPAQKVVTSVSTKRTPVKWTKEATITMAHNKMITMIKKMAKSLGLGIFGSAERRTQAVAAAIEKAKDYEFINMLNSKTEARKTLPLAIAYDLGLITEEELDKASKSTKTAEALQNRIAKVCKVLAVSGKFENVVPGKDGFPINPVCMFSFWAAPGNDQNEKREGKSNHAGMWAKEANDGTFVNISLKTGIKADVTMAVLNSEGEFVKLNGEDMVGYIGEDFFVKADVDRDLGGDADVFEAVEILSEIHKGRRADLTLIVQEKGGKYLDGKKKFSTQRVSAMVLIKRFPAAVLDREPENAKASRSAFSTTVVQKEQAPKATTVQETVGAAPLVEEEDALVKGVFFN